MQEINFKGSKGLSSIKCLENETILGIDKNLNEIMEDLESLSSFKTMGKDQVYDCNMLENNNDNDGNILKQNDSYNDAIGIFEIEDDSDDCSPEVNNENNLNQNRPEQVEDVAVSSYYSSGESIADSVNSSASVASKKMKKRFCTKCGVHFRKRRDLLAHIKIHVALPIIKIQKLSDSHKIVKEFLNTVVERNERKSDGISCEQTGKLRLKLKMSASQNNFEVVPQPDLMKVDLGEVDVVPQTDLKADDLNKVEAVPHTDLKAGDLDKVEAVPHPDLKLGDLDKVEAVPHTDLKAGDLDKIEPPRSKGIRVLKAQEIKWTEPPIKTPTSGILADTNSSNNLQNNVKEEESIENRYFECPPLDGLEQFAEEMNPEKTEELLKKLLAGGHQDFSATEIDWPCNTNEFISIDSLAHMCTVCHSRFGNGHELFEHKKLTGHDFNNPMQPPPMPSIPIRAMMDMNNFNRPRVNFLVPGSSHPRQCGFEQNGPRILAPPCRPNLELRFNHMLPTLAPSNRSAYPRLLTHPQQQQQHQQQLMMPRQIISPPPLYRMPGQNIQESNPSYRGATSNENFRQQTNISSTYPSTSPQPTNQDLMKQSVFLKSRQTTRPQGPKSSTSPPMFGQQTAVRPRFLFSQNSNTCLDPQHSSSPVNGQPPSKKNKIEPTIPQKVNSSAPRKEGLPIIQSVHSGPSVQNLQEKSKDLQSLDLNVSNGNKIKEANKNPKDVANLLATRGIIVTHKGKAANASNASETQPSSNSNDAIQKMQLNNSVSIITKKKEDQNCTSNSKMKVSADKTVSENIKFLSCPFPNCKEKFLRVDYLNRHTYRDHHYSSKTERQSSEKILRAYKCKICSALFSTQESLIDHQNRSHFTKTTADEIGIPIIDLRNEDTKKKLALIGITNYIPLSSKNNNGFFGFPIVSVQGSSNPNVYNLGALGSGAILSLGPIKQVPSRNPTSEN